MKFWKLSKGWVQTVKVGPFSLFAFEFVLCSITSSKISLSSYGTFAYKYVIIEWSCDILNSKCLCMYKTSQYIEPEHFRNLWYSFTHPPVHPSIHSLNIYWHLLSSGIALGTGDTAATKEKRNTYSHEAYAGERFLHKQLGETVFSYINNIAHLYLIIRNSYRDQHNKVKKFNIDKEKIKLGKQRWYCNLGEL